MSEDIVLSMGTKVVKLSGKPFKFGGKVGTIAEYMTSPYTGKLCYVIYECGSYIETKKCREYHESN